MCCTEGAGSWLARRLGWQFPSLSLVIPTHRAARRAADTQGFTLCPSPAWASISHSEPTLCPNSLSSRGFFSGTRCRPLFLLAPGVSLLLSKPCFCNPCRGSGMAEEPAWVNHSPGSPCSTQRPPCPSRLLIASKGTEITRDVLLTSPGLRSGSQTLPYFPHLLLHPVPANWLQYVANLNF